LAYKSNLGIVPSLACDPYLAFVTSFVPILVSSLDDDSEDEIHLCLLTFLQMSPLNLNQHQHHRFLDGSIQNEKQLVILSVILHIHVRHVHNSINHLLFWLKF
jgi:hypothetical protein